MTRISFSRKLLLALSSTMAWSMGGPALAATESSAISFTLGASGNDAALTGQGPSITLTVPNNFNQRLPLSDFSRLGFC